MEIVTVNDIKYINSNYILKNAPIYSKGIRSTRELMKKKKFVKETDYIYLRLKNNKFIKSTGKSIRLDKVFIKKSLIDTIPELNNGKGITDDGILEAPEIIILEDNEKFFDDKGNTLDIETRGERNRKGIYFKVKDVENCFNLKRLNDTINEKTTNYSNGIDYKYFICKDTKTLGKKQIKILFLTYQGILRVLFTTRNNKTTKFINWMTDTLFTVQLGTKEQKQMLCDKILGTDLESSRKVVKTNNNNLSAIYLLTLGYVKDLKEEMNLENYNDEDIVCKYGRSDDLSRRLTEHKKTFKLIKTANPMLKIHTYIDSNYASKAENKIKRFFKGANKCIKYKDFDELIIINKEFMKNTIEQYSLIASHYIGTQHDTISAIKDIEYSHKMLLMEKNFIIKQQESEIYNMKEMHKLEIENKEKENEILQLKLTIAEMK